MENKTKDFAHFIRSLAIAFGKEERVSKSAGGEFYSIYASVLFNLDVQWAKALSKVLDEFDYMPSPKQIKDVLCGRKNDHLKQRATLILLDIDSMVKEYGTNNAKKALYETSELNRYIISRLGGWSRISKRKISDGPDFYRNRDAVEAILLEIKSNPTLLSSQKPVELLEEKKESYEKPTEDQIRKVKELVSETLKEIK